MVTVKIPDNAHPWRCNINGVEYCYEAGSTQSVPEAVAQLIHDIEAAAKKPAPVDPPFPIPEGGGGGGGGGGMVVKFEKKGTSSLGFLEWKADKTLEEIIEAVEAGQSVQAVFDSTGVGENLDGVVEGTYYGMPLESCTPDGDMVGSFPNVSFSFGTVKNDDFGNLSWFVVAASISNDGADDSVFVSSGYTILHPAQPDADGTYNFTLTLGDTSGFSWESAV